VPFSYIHKTYPSTIKEFRLGLQRTLSVFVIVKNIFFTISVLILRLKVLVYCFLNETNFSFVAGLAET
jgi:hypothetical protein